MDPVQKPLLRALAGEAVWPPPFWLMRQAGRYLPEYRQLRAQAGDFISLCNNPPLAAEVTLQPLRRFGMDGAILFSDILMVPWALGQGLRYAEGEGPLLEPVRDAEAFARLDPSMLRGKIASIIETVSRVSAGLAAEAPKAALIGFAGSPFTVACYMVEGKGGGEFAHARRMAYGDPVLFGKLIRLLVDATVEYLLAQADAGAEALMLFDSWAGLLPPNQFRRWSIEPSAAIVRAIRKVRPDIPLIGFPRLAGPLLPEYAARVGVGTVAMDTGMDPRWAVANVPPGITLQGNLDPQVVVAGGEAMEAEARALLAAMRGRPFVFNLGHGIVPPTPPEHVGALARIIRMG
ncbi:uroporphyrinogen decarboxylase [Roseomonas haemaphysalidis]|uniref:Uroporphyrinogen decarboxylase n=1 Tax=Roseomonas haemaphysalidis TaxID=2768162 RepID=A0ABS3KSZ7_9PROT|nr:uroporphyrinogen decarboxylase [Roseomonas haemaphysalidis]MBO1080593.1 uroporphyrinogen decarboxylase [Roseomonas haemaphysalidis]